MNERKATILAVDDEEYTRRLFECMLGEAGYRVVTVSSGQEALEKLSSGDIDMVLLDIKMPGMDGFQTLELIKEKTDIPVMMVTGMADETSLRTSLTLGADGYIKKPFRLDELVARVESKLRRGKRSL